MHLFLLFNLFPLHKSPVCLPLPNDDLSAGFDGTSGIDRGRDEEDLSLLSARTVFIGANIRFSVQTGKTALIPPQCRKHIVSESWVQGLKMGHLFFEGPGIACRASLVQSTGRREAPVGGGNTKPGIFTAHIGQGDVATYKGRRR